MSTVVTLADKLKKYYKEDGVSSCERAELITALETLRDAASTVKPAKASLITFVKFYDLLYSKELSKLTGELDLLKYGVLNDRKDLVETKVQGKIKINNNIPKYKGGQEDFLDGCLSRDQ